MPNRKRPLIAFFTSVLEGNYSSILCRGVSDAAEALGIDLLILPGNALQSLEEHNYQYNVLFEYVSSRNIDGLVLAGGAIAAASSEEAFQQFFRPYERLPSVGISLNVSGLPKVLCDNATGFHQAVDHLVTVHQRKRIAFLSGPEGNIDAIERARVFRETLEPHGLFDPELIIQGDFTHFGTPTALKKFWVEKNKNFDALVAANDEMAISAMIELEKRGIQVPKEVSVVGFDNVLEASSFKPTLTTVNQPVYQIGYRAVELVLSQIEGKPAEGELLPARMVVRESCGCRPESMEDPEQDVTSLAVNFEAEALVGALLQKKDSQGKMLILSDPTAQNKVLNGLSAAVDPTRGGLPEIRHLHSSLTGWRRELLLSLKGSEERSLAEDFFHISRLHLGERYVQLQSRRWGAHMDVLQELRRMIKLMLVNMGDLGAMFSSLIASFRALGIESAGVWLYPESFRHARHDSWNLPRTLDTIFEFGTSRGRSETTGKAISLLEIVPQFFASQKNRKTCVLHPLYLLEEQMGVLMTDFVRTDTTVHETLLVQFSALLKLSNLIRSRQQIEEQLRKAMLNLEAFNNELSLLSQTDELTGLYNRRGFLNLGQQGMNLAVALGKTGLLCFADMDGLKIVNDTYGHDEGDEAIKSMALILKQTFRSTDIIGRLGGDEFTVIASNSDMEMLEVFQKRMRLFIDQFNRGSGKPWKLSISMGAVPFGITGATSSLSELLSQADYLLYERKRLKRTGPSQTPTDA